MYGTILAFIKFNNFDTWQLNGPRHLFYSFCCTTQCIFEPLHVYELSFNTDKYGVYIYIYMYMYVCIYRIASNYGPGIYFFPVNFNQATKRDRRLLPEETRAVYNRSC